MSAVDVEDPTLANAGEMAERIHSFDWSQTPIGPAESWSPALRMMVSVLLANRFPMLLWWGPDFVSIYNDAYRPILGIKHPQALGQPVRVCWSEIWHVLQPLIETPFRGGPATWMDDICLEINRHGFTEETHFTIGYSPVPDDSVPGGIGGVLAAVTEITEKVISERRVVALGDLGTRAVGAKSAEEACRICAGALASHSRDVPFTRLYLIDSDRRNASLAASSGLDPQAARRLETVSLVAEPAGAFAVTVRATVETGETQVLAPLSEFLQAVPAGPWSDPSPAAAVVPIRSHLPHQMAAVLVAGISSRLRFDDRYRSFLQLAAGQIGTAIASARAYDEERKRAESLAELDRAKTAFFSNVSHEFRTPLTLIQGPLEALLSSPGPSLTPDVRSELETVHRNSRRLLKLVNTLLDFSKAEAGRLEARYVPTDLSAHTAELASLFRSAVENAGLQYTVDCPALPEPVYVDREMWEKIVLNLLSNAFKFTLKGAIAVRIRPRGDWIEVAISDTGSGIPADELSRIFDRFHRVEGTSARSHEGTGIGLALVRELVNLHGGNVRVESAAGTGSTFTVELRTGFGHLPAERIGEAARPPGTGTSLSFLADEAQRWEPAARSAKSIPAPPASEASATQRPARILVVDDNADMRDYVRRLLESRYEVEVAADGEIALELARQRLPDLILSDVMMPRMDGLTLLEHLRAHERLRTIPTVLISARAGEEARVAGLDSGADEYLVKPFSARELIARIRSQLDLAELRRESAERLSSILESITDGFHVVDSSGRFTQFNAAARAMFGAEGIDTHTLVGRPVFEAFPEGADSQGGRALARALKGRGPTSVESYYAPWRRWYSTRHYPMPDGGVATFLQDITERKQAEEALRESEERYRQLAERLEHVVAQRTAALQEKVGDLEAFSYSVSHDMRGPLRSMQGFANALLEDYGRSFDPTARDYLRRIDRAAHRLDLLVRDVLAYSKLAKGEFEFERVELGAFLFELLQSANPGGLAVRIIDPLPNVRAHPALLSQIFSNLLGNAAKFTRPGVPPAVRIWGAERSGRVKVWVEDNGIGIAPEHFQRIFQIFGRVHADHQYEGTGIGLAIVKKAAERLGGKVGVESDCGTGSRFWVELRGE